MKLLLKDFLRDDGLKPYWILYGIYPRLESRGNSKNHGNSVNSSVLLPRCISWGQLREKKIIPEWIQSLEENTNMALNFFYK